MNCLRSARERETYLAKLDYHSHIEFSGSKARGFISPAINKTAGLGDENPRYEFISGRSQARFQLWRSNQCEIERAPDELIN